MLRSIPQVIFFLAGLSASLVLADSIQCSNPAGDILYQKSWYAGDAPPPGGGGTVTSWKIRGQEFKDSEIREVILRQQPFENLKTGFYVKTYMKRVDLSRIDGERFLDGSLSIPAPMGCMSLMSH